MATAETNPGRTPTDITPSVQQLEAPLGEHLRSDAAQQAFASGGETAYLQHVLRHSQARQALQDDAATRATVQNIIRPMHRVAPVQFARSRFLFSLPAEVKAAMDDYTRISARQRNDYLHELPSHNRAGTLVSALRGQLPVWHAGRVTRYVTAANAARTEREAARQAFIARMGQHMVAYTTNHGEVVDKRAAGFDITDRAAIAYRLALLSMMEHAIARQRQETAPDQRSWQAAYERWVARRWFGQRGLWFRIGAVAVPAAALGVGSGLLVEALGTPAAVATAVGVGVVYVGGKLGHFVADAANRRQLAAPARRQQDLENMRARDVAEKNHFIRNAQAYEAAPDSFDITLPIEQGTFQEAQANYRRRQWAGSIGRIAAGLGFAFGAFGGDAWLRPATGRVHQHAAQTVTPTPRSTPTSPGSPTNFDQLPWNFARQEVRSHHLSTSPLNLVRQAMSKANAQFGSHLHFVQHGTLPNGEPDLWVTNGTRALNRAQQMAFNRVIAAIAS